MVEITKEMTIAEVLGDFPEAAEVFMEYGLPCVGCHISLVESIEEGAMSHGMPLEVIDRMISDVNTLINRDEFASGEDDDIMSASGLHDLKHDDDLDFKSKIGLNEEVVRKISSDKDEPDWMLKKRLESLEICKKKKMTSWGPELSHLKLDDISYYVKPKANKNAQSWKKVPENIKETFDKLGVIKGEKDVLGGAGAQYESEVVYHSLKEKYSSQGVIFLDMDEALVEYSDLVKEYFMTKCINPNLHKFSAVHGAVWSGGTFIYVPKGVKVDEPLQSYFRMNTKSSGQFEHTLIILDEGAECSYIEGCSAAFYSSNSLHAGCVEIFVKKNAKMRYYSVENWSRNVYNLNTKRAIVEENGTMEWIGANVGSKVAMLYPTSILVGDNSTTDAVGVSFASTGQSQDLGIKVIHVGKNTKSKIVSKSVTKNGGISSYRGQVSILKSADGAISSVDCDALMLDSKSRSNTYPYIDVSNENAIIAHEASVGKINEDDIFYLMSRGISEDDAKKMIVSGFLEPIVRKLPLDYAVELNKLIEMEMDKSLG